MADEIDVNKFEKEFHISDFFCDESEEIDDDWFYESIRRYKHLLMYELASPTSCLEFCDNGNLCLSLDHLPEPNVKNELLVLSLPAKLRTQNEQEEGLCKHRDFEVSSGASLDQTINQICPMPGSNKIAISNKNGVSFYESDYSKGTISRKANFSQCDPEPCVATTATTIAAGSSTEKIAIYNPASLDPVHVLKVAERAEQLSALKFLNNETVIASSLGTGSLFVRDLRTQTNIELPCTSDKFSESEWTFDVHAESHLIGQLSSRGRVLLRDFRKADVNMAVYELPAESCQSSRHFKIRLSPCGSMFSLSGLDDTVMVYSVSCNSKPLFVHDGHKRTISGTVSTSLTTSHTWHPSVPNLLFSSSRNNSFHAWQFEPVF